MVLAMGTDEGRPRHTPLPWLMSAELSPAVVTWTGGHMGVMMVRGTAAGLGSAGRAAGATVTWR